MQNQSVLNANQAQSTLVKVRLFFQKNFFIIIAAVTFFLLITAQTLWSTIHGDGAVYAWITKELALGGWSVGKLPNWTQAQPFAEHPFLFFYFASVFVKLFGVSDLVLKLPNYLVAAFSLFAVYKASQQTAKNQAVALIACYALLLNGTYFMQISQPTLDPMAQLLSLISVLVLIFGENAFLAGVVIGLAFLTKGLELLPNLAALVLTSAFIQRTSIKKILKNSMLIGAGVLIPVFGWLVLDKVLWNGQWLSTYWNRQFVNRFFSTTNNVDKASGPAYLMTFIRVYFLELFIFSVWFLVTDAWKKKRSDPLFLFFVSYCILNMAAFLIIKKDSSQHVTGVLVAGAVFVGEAVFDIWKKLGSRRLWAVPVSLLAIAGAYWSWYFVNSKANPDIWTIVKNESLVYKGQEPLPVVIRDTMAESYGLFHTAQWYTQSDQIFLQSEADRLIGKEVVYFSQKENGQLVAARVIYKKDLY